jgi:peptidoglycan/xylan/chitin deacetylase (PgdA/CDA1 family)
MSNPRVPYAFYNDRPALPPPDRGAILVHLVINVENWVFDAGMPRTIITPPHGKASIPDVPNYSWVEYGMRVGLPRMIEAISARGLKASTSCNASGVDSYPRAAEAMLDAGWEFIAHGYSQQALDELSERDVIERSVEKLERFTGRKVRGWLSPGLRESNDTPDILAQAGIKYVCDWVIDDLPNWMSVQRGTLLQMPYNLELNDSVIYAIEKHSSDEFILRLRNTLKLFERECVRHPKVLALGLHPHLMGVPHRFGSFEDMLDLLIASPQVCFMTGSDIYDWYSSHVPGLDKNAAMEARKV